MENTSGQGKLSVVPDEIKGWSWGAFFLNWIWGICNGTFIALLCFVPLLNIIMVFVLGAKGREWAWRNAKWEGIDHFNRVQRLWSIWGVVLVVGVPLLGIVAAIIIPLLARK